MEPINYLKKREWSMGNGQCPECCGCNPDAGWWTSEVGHEVTCELAQSLESLGVTAQWKRRNIERDARMANPKTVRDFAEKKYLDWCKESVERAILKALGDEF